MSEIKQRLIDGDKLLNRAKEITESPLTPSMELWELINEIENGDFNIPSDQGEATRLQNRVTLLENYLEELREVTPYGMVKEQISNILNESRALSSHTEDTRSTDTPEQIAIRSYNDGFRDGKNLDDEYTGIQKVRELYNEWNKMESWTGYSSQTIASIIVDTVNMLGITIPGINTEER